MNTPTPEINIEEIMQQIRTQILAQRAAQTGTTPPISLQGKRLPPEFYEHLYQAGLVYDQIKPNLYVTKIPIPLIGPLLEQLRQKIHELVMFYVGHLAMQQIKMNTHLLQALSLLAEELERTTEKPTT